MFKKIFFLIAILVLFGFQFGSKDNADKYLIIDLIHEKFDKEFYTDKDFYYTALKLESFNYYPKYSKYLKENYKGIPENDSVSYYGCFKDRFLQDDLYKLGDLNEEDEDWYLSNKDNDTLSLSKVRLKGTVIVVIGFNKNKQFMIADVNRNKDFSDDVKFEYDINFRNHPYDNIDFLNTLPVAEYAYEDYYKGNIQIYNRQFIIYPDRDNRYSISDRVNPKKEREYFSVLKIRDYWKGKATINNEEINFYYHGYSNKYGILYIKPNNIPYKRNNAGYESQYSHKYYNNDRYDDTITIFENRYKIDSINRDISKLYLREVGKIQHFGNEIGNYVNNFDFKDLDGRTVQIKDVINKKHFTLLEFWGTWCGPCIKLTPKLKKMQQKYFSNVTFVGMAVDENINSVKKYTTKHNMNWMLGYISKKESWKNPIIKQLKVQFYPTFILINSKGKIIYKGSSDTFEDIEKLLNQ